MKILAISTLVCAALISTGCFHDTDAAPDASTTPSTNNQAAVSGGLDYPQLYKDGNLPEHPNVSLTDIGRQQESLRDGLSLKLESNETVRTLTEYYKSEFTSLGWTVPEERVANDSVYIGSYTKGDLTYQITIRKASANTLISISYLQN